ncbi:MAG: ChaN family lipoprotein, partial [Phycisphaerales bacterium]|nr:ChaN family lipoprotein [Phycisphaerales bacterium]
FIAEQHGHPLGLSAAAELWRAVLKNGSPFPPALALEFFERDDQSRIDDYLAGLSTEDIFRKRTGKTLLPGADPGGWAGSYPPGHRDMVEAAKKAGVPVLAANAPRAYVRLARTKGYPALALLTPEQQRLVVLPRFAAEGNRPDNRYWHDFLKFMGSTPEKYATSSAEEREKSDAMFRSQSTWDATMADTVRKALAEGHAPVFLVIGQFHADFAGGAEGGGGTVLALKAARPETRVIVVSFQDADPNGGFRAEDKGRADFLVYCGPRPEK